RDILRKIGVGTRNVLRPRKDLSPSSPARIGTLGMEHFTERDVVGFRGREIETGAVADLVGAHPLALVIGDSGIGKTSLIQAGVFPTVRQRGWGLAWCRPLDDPDRTIPHTLWEQLMKDALPQVNIGTTLRLIADAYEGRQVLVAIDQ